MFGRAPSRTAARGARCFSQAAHQPHPSPFTKQSTPFKRLPSRTRVPIQPCISLRQRSTVQAARELFREYPFSVSLASVLILFGAGVLLYSNYVYNTYIIGAFHKYPEPVAQKLRRALYYTNISLSPKDAIKYYKQALDVADELGMDPFSDEILGVKIQLASLLEKVHNYQRSIEVLEIVRRDCRRWMDELGAKHFDDGKRTRVLQRMVGISVKLGELYANEYVLDREAAEESLVWAVETVLREKRRREGEGVREGEGEWMTDEEIGGALESLAHHYDEKDQHYLATPLFLQALALSPPKSCHTIVLMNNLATSLAQQHAPASPADGAPAPSRAALVGQARQWAAKALALAAAIAPPDRTAECDQGCAVATHNLAEFAEMEGDVREARRRYDEARGLARAIGFAEGVGRAEEGLRRVGGVEGRR